MELENKIGLITGAGSGIGQACAQRLAKEGAKVIVADINRESAAHTVELIEKDGGDALAVYMDVSNEESVQKAFADGVKHFGGLDIIYANAGIQIVNPFEDYSFEDWKKIIAVMGDGVFLTCREAYRIMKDRGGGQIVIAGSMHSHVASILKGPYCYAKHGVLGLARVIAKEGVPYNIHSYVICPGMTRTPLLDKQIPEQAQIKGMSEEEVISKIILANTIDGKFSTVDEVSNLLVFFAKDTQGALSGQSVMLTHGWGML